MYKNKLYNYTKLTKGKTDDFPMLSKMPGKTSCTIVYCCIMYKNTQCEDRRSPPQRKSNSAGKESMKKEEKSIQNPFRPGNGIMPPYLAGRESIIERFEASLDTALSLPQNLVITGVRGTGKTVLLQRLEESCVRKNWLFVRREMSTRFNNELDFLTAICADLTVKIQGITVGRKPTGRPIGHRGGFFDEIDAVGELQLIEHLKNFQGTLGDWLEKVFGEMDAIVRETRHNGLVILYDESHVLEDERVEASFPLSLLIEVLSRVQQKNMRFYLLLAGLPPLLPNLSRAKTYTERMFSVRTLEHLTREASRRALEVPLEEAGLSFSKTLIERIVEETRGYPYFLQFYAFYLIQNVPKQRLGIAEYERLHPFLLKELDDSFFLGRFEKASEAEQKVLFAISGFGQGARVSDIRKKTGIDRNYLNQILKHLMDKGILYRVSRGRYAFTLPLFGEFLLRKRKQLQRAIRSSVNRTSGPGRRHGPTSSTASPGSCP